MSHVVLLTSVLILLSRASGLCENFLIQVCLVWCVRVTDPSFYHTSCDTLPDPILDTLQVMLICEPERQGGEDCEKCVVV